MNFFPEDTGGHPRRSGVTLSNLSSLEKKLSKKIASCKNYTTSHIKVHKPHPISDQNGQNLYPISEKGSKTIPFGAAHTYKGVHPPGFNTPLKNGEISMPTLYRQLDFTDGQQREIDAFIIQTVSIQHGEILISSLYRQLLFAIDQRRDIVSFILQTTGLCFHTIIILPCELFLEMEHISLLIFNCQNQIS